jgi:hypothetical protein
LVETEWSSASWQTSGELHRKLADQYEPRKDQDPAGAVTIATRPVNTRSRAASSLGRVRTDEESRNTMWSNLRDERFAETKNPCVFHTRWISPGSGNSIPISLRTPDMGTRDRP